MACIARRSVASPTVGFGKRNEEELAGLLKTLDGYIKKYTSK